MIAATDLFDYYATEIDRDDYIEFLIKEQEVDVDESMIEDYNKYLDSHGENKLYDDLDELLCGRTPTEVIEEIDFDNFNIGHPYFRYNDYCCVESVDELTLVSEMEKDVDFLDWYIRKTIDWSEVDEVIKKTNEIVKNEY